MTTPPMRFPTHLRRLTVAPPNHAPMRIVALEQATRPGPTSCSIAALEVSLLTVPTRMSTAPKRGFLLDGIAEQLRQVRGESIAVPRLKAHLEYQVAGRGNPTHHAHLCSISTPDAPVNLRVFFPELRPGADILTVVTRGA